MSQESEKAVQEAYPELFVSFTDNVEENDIDFEFELERELDDDEWQRMPSVLRIYDVDGGVFRGAYVRIVR